MNRLKELREDRDLFQKDIAKLIHIDQSNYSKYELEKINITIETLHLLADFYNTSIDYILYRTDVRKAYPKSIVNEKTAQLNYAVFYISNKLNWLVSGKLPNTPKLLSLSIVVPFTWPRKPKSSIL